MAVRAKFANDKTITAMVALLRQGATRQQIHAKICKTVQLSTRKLDSLLKEARHLHTQEAQTLQKAELEGLTEARKKEALESVLSVLDRKLILSEIARGELVLQKPMVVNKEIQVIDVVPNYEDRRAAIAELNKMDGAYAPTEIKGTLDVRAVHVIIPGELPNQPNAAE
jgi:hypothetical protein